LTEKGWGKGTDQEKKWLKKQIPIPRRLNISRKATFGRPDGRSHTQKNAQKVSTTKKVPREQRPTKKEPEKRSRAERIQTGWRLLQRSEMALKN